MENLNELGIRGRVDDSSLQDFSAISSDGNVQVYFKNIESHLVRHIENADIVVGCVAWLTSPAILRALSKKKGVSIIVQKEDWLRPDLHDRGDWKSRQKSRYSQLRSALARLDIAFTDTILSEMSYCGDPSLDAVRCVGNNNSLRLPAFPRMHHKFIVLCREAETKPHGYMNYEPYEVWTGSFNFTKNAASSFENAIVMKDVRLVKAFFSEFAQIAALSEPLDWESDWVQPQWRFGS